MIQETPVKWRSIIGFPGYFVSNTGLVKAGNTILKQKQKKRASCAYKYVAMACGAGKFPIQEVHKLVWQAFGSKPLKKGWDVHHIDEDILNNNISNLTTIPHREHMKLHSVKRLRSKGVFV